MRLIFCGLVLIFTDFSINVTNIQLWSLGLGCLRLKRNMFALLQDIGEQRVYEPGLPVCPGGQRLDSAGKGRYGRSASVSCSARRVLSGSGRHRESLRAVFMAQHHQSLFKS